LRKWFLGSAFSATCRACGGKVSVTYGSTLAAMLPFFAAVVVAPFVGSLWVKALTWVLGFGVGSALFLWRVPLIKR
jgi:hypothetical protein